MSISDFKKNARIALKGNWGEGALVTFLVFVITIIPSFAIEVALSGGFYNWFIQDETPILADIFNTLLSLALIPITISAYWYFLSVSRFEGPKPSDLFKIFNDGNRYLKLIGTSILQGILIFLWTILLIIPGIIKSLSYSQTFYLLKDNPELTPLEAISESKERMKGYKWKYFVLNLSFIGWAILCIFTLGIGFLWLSPYISTSQAAFYDEYIVSQGQMNEDENY